MYKIMTPGPTQVAPHVLSARSLPCTNPDIDHTFFDYYRETCARFSSFFHTSNETLILSGEGILGLEAACASLTEPGDRVLVLDNGVYGRGFGDFVKLYGGEPVYLQNDYKETFSPSLLEDFLAKDHAFKYATLVHCDTPSAMLNDIHTLCPILKKYGLLTVVDSVSAMFGHDVNVDQAGIDLLLGGSQKALSAPPGLTTVTISEKAKKAIDNRKIPVAGFYTNLGIFKDYYEKKWFPYTMPISDIYGLRAALDGLYEDSTLFQRHEELARSTRQTLLHCGLSLYQNSGFSNTVTAFVVPEGTTDFAILDTLKREYQILLTGSFDHFAGQLIRIGHMGTNANPDDLLSLFCALEGTLKKLGVSLKASLVSTFAQELSKTTSF